MASINIVVDYNSWLLIVSSEMRIDIFGDGIELGINYMKAVNSR